MAESYPRGQKTLWEKEKLLLTSNFSFSHSVFKGLLLQTSENKGLLRKGLNISILHRLSNKFLQLILISLNSASWKLHQPNVLANENIQLDAWSQESNLGPYDCNLF